MRSRHGQDEGRLDVIRKDLNKTTTFWFVDQNLHLKCVAVDPWNVLSFQLNQAGYCAFFGGHGNASDASLKSATEDASTEDCLHMLRQASVRTYERTDMPGTGSILGFLAQEVRDAAPAAFGGLAGTTPYGERMPLAVHQESASKGGSTGGQTAAVR